MVKIAAYLSVIALLVGCGGDSKQGSDVETSGVSESEIRIGTHTDLSGPVAIWGVGVTNGARLRFSEINEAGGVHDRQIRFIVEDTTYAVPKAISAANKLINRDGIFAMLMGLGTPANNAIMPIQFAANVPNLFPISGGRKMIMPFHKLKFTQRGTYYDEMRAAVKYFVNERQKQRVCVVYQDTDYGQEILDGVEDQVKAMGLKVVAFSSHKPTETEFTAVILKLKNANCDVVMMGTIHTDTILILDAAKKIGWANVDWVGNNATYAQVVAEQESAEGYFCFTHMAKIYSDEEMSPELKAWWDRYVAMFDEEPGVPAMEGYRAADLVYEALDRAGEDLTTDGFISALESIDEYTDLFGYRVSFGPNKHGGATESVLTQVKDGRWVALEQAVSY